MNSNYFYSNIVQTSKNKSFLEEMQSIYNPQIEMFAHFKTKSSFHKTKGII